MIDLFTEYKRFGIFGPSECGKTTLARRISHEFFVLENRWTIVLAPNDGTQEQWGKHARIFRNEAQFWEFVATTNNCLVIVDDASVTIARDDSLSGVFTTMRHQGHKLVVIGHSATNLLPQMRDQLQRLFLFLQNEQAIKLWENVFMGQDLSEAMRLQQYEFLTVANFKPQLKSKLEQGG